MVAIEGEVKTGFANLVSGETDGTSEKSYTFVIPELTLWLSVGVVCGREKEKK